MRVGYKPFGLVVRSYTSIIGADCMPKRISLSRLSYIVTCLAVGLLGVGVAEWIFSRGPALVIDRAEFSFGHVRPGEEGGGNVQVRNLTRQPIRVHPEVACANSTPTQVVV